MTSKEESKVSESTPARAGLVRKRLLRGFGASALGPVVTIIIQVVSVPIFLHYWGAKLYGEWLILSAIPSYLALSDLGFGSVAANDMTMRVAAGDREGALEAFQSTWILTTISSLLAGAVVIAGIYLFPLARWVNLSSLSASDARLILLLLSAYSLLCLQGTPMISGFKCEGNFALGVLINNQLRISESAFSTALVLFHAKPTHVAASLLIIRSVGSFVMSRVMQAKSPWLRYGSSHATMDCTRRLLGPAIAYMAFPAGNALSIQGIVLVVGVVLGPVAVTVFSTMRTLTRFAFQIMESIKNSVWPELSAAYGAGNWPLARKLHRAACQISLWASLAAVAFLAIAGGRIFAIWTHGRVVPDMRTFYLLLLVIVANSFWNASSVVTIASNTHQRVASLYLLGTSAAIVIAYVLTSRMGLPGAAASLLVIDVALIWYVLGSSLRSLGDERGDFVKAMFRLPNIAPLRG